MALGQRITVIEPHADDAFLSMGGHLEQWAIAGIETKIVTVYSNTRKRQADAKAYAEAIGAKWQGLGYVEAEKGYKTGELGYIPNAILYDADIDEIVITPLGIGHPEHRFVTSLIDTSYHYLDQPYAMIQKYKEEVNSKLNGKIARSYLLPSVKKYKHIPLFKDQSAFFHYNPVDKLRWNIELVLENTDLKIL